VPQLKGLKVGSPFVLPWEHVETWMDHEPMAIQEAAGIKLPCTLPTSHECTPNCFVYTLHDFWRAHATYNYGRVTDWELQRQMGQASFATTRSYAKYAESRRQSHYDAHVSKLVKAKSRGLKVAGGTVESQYGGYMADKPRIGGATA
jgi:hypothetical protein